eukprot:UN04553
MLPEIAQYPAKYPTYHAFNTNYYQFFGHKTIDVIFDPLFSCTLEYSGLSCHFGRCTDNHISRRYYYHYIKNSNINTTPTTINNNTVDKNNNNNSTTNKASSDTNNNNNKHNFNYPLLQFDTVRNKQTHLIEHSFVYGFDTFINKQQQYKEKDITNNNDHDDDQDQDNNHYSETNINNIYPCNPHFWHNPAMMLINIENSYTRLNLDLRQYPTKVQPWETDQFIPYYQSMILNHHNHNIFDINIKTPTSSDISLFLKSITTHPGKYNIVDNRVLFKQQIIQNQQLYNEIMNKTTISRWYPTPDYIIYKQQCDIKSGTQLPTHQPRHIMQECQLRFNYTNQIYSYTSAYSSSLALNHDDNDHNNNYNNDIDNKNNKNNNNNTNK